MIYLVEMGSKRFLAVRNHSVPFTDADAFTAIYGEKSPKPLTGYDWPTVTPLGDQSFGKLVEIQLVAKVSVSLIGVKPAAARRKRKAKK